MPTAPHRRHLTEYLNLTLLSVQLPRLLYFYRHHLLEIIPAFAGCLGRRYRDRQS